MKTATVYLVLIITKLQNELRYNNNNNNKTKNKKETQRKQKSWKNNEKNGGNRNYVGYVPRHEPKNRINYVS